MLWTHTQPPSLAPQPLLAEITVQHQDGQGQGLAKHTWESHSVWLKQYLSQGLQGGQASQS